eukprot:5871919-Pleurochrysis_carterae.AAC.7
MADANGMMHRKVLRCMRAATRRRRVRSNSGVRVRVRAWYVCACDAVLRRRAAYSMRVCRTRVRRFFRS